MDINWMNFGKNIEMYYLTGAVSSAFGYSSSLFE